MKVKYIGESFGLFGLTDGNIYECTGIQGSMLMVIDDEEFDDEGYLYSIKNPAPADGSSKGGRWEIIKDNDNKDLEKAFKLYA